MSKKSENIKGIIRIRKSKKRSTDSKMTKRKRTNIKLKIE